MPKSGLRITIAHIVLLAILLIAALARLWGIRFGLPHTECRPDESLIVKVTMGFGSGDLNPHFFRYPTLYMYILLALYVCYFLVGMASGRYGSMVDFAAEFSSNPTNFYLISRFLSAMLGIAAVLIVYRTAKQLFDERTGLVSALFLSLAYLHVRDSHFGVTDVAVTFFIMSAILLIVRTRREKTARSYVYAGALTGLATSTKYQAIILLVPMLVAHVFNILDERGRDIRRLLDRRILLFAMALALAFLLGTPFALLDFRSFLSDLMFEIQHLGRGHLINLGQGWWYHLRYSLAIGLGWLLFFASLMGIILMSGADWKKWAVFCSFPVLYYVAIARGYTVFLRYAVPLVPFLCVTGAFCVVWLGNRLLMRWRRPIGSIGLILVAALLILPSAYNVVRFNALLAEKDNRLIATEWFQRNVDAGSTVYQAGSWAGKLKLFPTLESLWGAYQQRLSEGGGRVLRARIDYMQKEGIPGYDEWAYDAQSNQFSFEGEAQDGLPTYILTETSPLIVYSRTPEGIAELVDDRYSLVKSFEVIDILNQQNFFDQLDTFYIPFAGFHDVERPGPNIYIYQQNQP